MEASLNTGPEGEHGYCRAEQNRHEAENHVHDELPPGQDDKGHDGDDGDQVPECSEISSHIGSLAHGNSNNGRDRAS